MSEASLLRPDVGMAPSYTEPVGGAGADEKESAAGFEFPGWGSTTRITDLSDKSVLVVSEGADSADAVVAISPDDVPVEQPQAQAPPIRTWCAGLCRKDPDHRLGQFMATAISGNDITSSCLYVSGIAAQLAGPWTPVSLVLVALLLYLFRGVYSEVGSALPLNGGTYTLLLNTTSKPLAAAAACLTLLSYMATAVVSAASAMQYLQYIWPSLNVFWATVVLLCIFAALNLVGLTESASVALLIFVVHLGTLTALIVACTVQFARNPSLLVTNWHIQLPINPAACIFFGFSASLLGISGFESSANYIEEQKPGVFPKTLRNMWVAVAILNPAIALLSWCVLPSAEILDPARSASLLARMAAAAGGVPLQYVVVLDATLVLSGALLTSFVGVGGLLRRMSCDRVLPQFLQRTNRLRGTHHWIILLFLLICVSVFALVNGDVTVLSVVYTICFLCVMSLFAVGNMLLKYKRGTMPRATRSWWGTVLLAFTMVLVGLVTTVALSFGAFAYFALYYAITLCVVGAMFGAVRLLKLLLFFGRLVLRAPFVAPHRLEAFERAVKRAIVAQCAFRVVFFSKTDTLSTINKAILYCRDNEQANNIVVVHAYENEAAIPPHLEEHVRVLDRVYPKYRIDLVLVRGRFGPDLVRALSQRLGVPHNFMFITSYSQRFEHTVGELGGVRVITKGD